MEYQLWHLLDLRDGDGLGFTIDLFFLALRQLSSAAPSESPDTPSSSKLREAFYTGIFDVIKSNWEKSKNLAGTQRILLDILCDLIIQGRGMFSDFCFPRYIDDLLNDLMDESLRNRTNIRLRD